MALHSYGMHLLNRNTPAHMRRQFVRRRALAKDLEDERTILFETERQELAAAGEAGAADEERGERAVGSEQAGAAKMSSRHDESTFFFVFLGGGGMRDLGCLGRE